MFQIFSFKQLTIIAFILCFFLLLASALNLAAPYVSASSKQSYFIPVIMYHQISENPSVIGDYAIPLSLLEKDFLYIKNMGYTPISFKQLKNFTQKAIPLPENPIIITFDDGERTFITKVLPLLEKYNFPANVNIVGSLTKLYTENGETDDRYAYLNEEDILTLSRHELVEIGYHSYNCHTLGHRRGMGKIKGESDTEYEKIILDDIHKFNDYYKSITGQSTFIIAYPYGIKNPLLESIVAQNGFTVALTCREASNKISVGSSLLNLGRFNRPNKETTQDFFNKILKK